MSYRIFIADDEPLIRADLKELLEEMGHNVVAEADDGQHVLDTVETINPDVVILDIKMPQVDGIRVAKKISGRFPVIFLTAYTNRQLIKEAKDSGGMAYLAKPFREEDLAPAIELSITQFLKTSKLTQKVSRLKEQLENRKVIEKAKGLLMQNENLSEVEAYRKLQKISMKKNRSMKEVADAIILMM